MKTPFLAFGFALALVGCSSILEGPTQSVTLLTPGAEHAECMIHNKDFRYEMKSNETRKIMRSEHDMTVDCLAPGNREKSVVVENSITDAGVGNVTNLGVGLAYDYYDNSLYEYPSVITVDFRGVDPQSYGLPQYHTDDLPDPATLPIEDYTPKKPKTDFDRFTPKPVLEKIDRSYSGDFSASAETSASDSFMPAPLPAASSTPTPIGTTADELTRSMNPQVFQ